MQSKIIVGARRSGKTNLLINRYREAEFHGRNPFFIVPSKLRGLYLDGSGIPKDRIIVPSEIDRKIAGSNCETLLIDEYFQMTMGERENLDQIASFFGIVAVGTSNRIYNEILLNLVRYQRKYTPMSNVKFHSMFTEIAPDEELDEYWYNFLCHPNFVVETLSRNSWLDQEVYRQMLSPKQFDMEYLGNWRVK